ncbi:glycosyltransferase family 8 protein [Gilliamella sp. wkB112]|uniref:glycosyltransferase family 8 protein n=1 Tax=Gilliamella sp. wkB112 TaxID=3120257 RepID=UPI0009BD6AC5|nr:glycosyltransferase family 8 protein [Gilliamella apicola]
MFNSQNFIKTKNTIVKASSEHKSILHIALGFDNNYAMPAGIAMLSVIQNTFNYNLHFHLFIDQVSDSNIEKFKKLVTTKNVTITLYYINNDFVINPKTLVLHITTVSTCIRFIIPEILASITDKLIYLDSDVICLQSLAALAEYNIDNYIAGVIPDTKDMQNEIRTMYNIDSSQYFNAGVLLINTKKWNEFHISEQAFNLINNGNIYKYADQDVLNILFEHKTYPLPIKYNTKIKISTDAHQEKSIKSYTVILHYISQNKPWYKVYRSKIFKQYFKDSPWKNDPQPLSDNSSSIRNYAKYLARLHKYKAAFYYYLVYLKYKLYLKK